MATIINLFPGAVQNEDHDRFRWRNIPMSLQMHYNYILQIVIDHDKGIFGIQDKSPNYYNKTLCLALCECKPKLNTQNAAGNFILKPLATANSSNCCIDFKEADKYLMLPGFCYKRLLPDDHPITVPGGTAGASTMVSLDIDISSITVGSVIWLYYYERMGIFKILNALMDDYNYRGKYPISSNVDNGQFVNLYTQLMEEVSLLYRLGLSSTLPDRLCTYQRVLGVSIENNRNIESEKNEGFMKTFNKLIDYMLEFYKAKQLAQAIQNTGLQNNGPSGVRSSVATQTSIRDTIQVMKQHLESIEYGRNQLNTFLGIATVYITICLVRLIKEEIGIPKQYDTPDEFIPAAYDILVLKRPVTSKDINRFTIFDNCASYGYRLLTDIQLANVNVFKTGAQGTVFDIWLNDIEGIVEGYNNAYKSVDEPATAIV